VLEGFAQTRIDTGDAVINVRYAGDGPPILLLHGIPQTHVMWHRVARRAGPVQSHEGIPTHSELRATDAQCAQK
jgi:haloacetate dehalogenase